MTNHQADYQKQLEAESQKWGEHLKVEATGEFNAWLDHPLIASHYRERGLINGQSWEHFIRSHFGGPAERSFDLGCGAGGRSLAVYEAQAARWLDGADVSVDRVAEGQRIWQARGIPGQLRVDDINTLKLSTDTYDLIFSCHSFHHFLKLEEIMQQVHQALTRRGLFILEEFVGPTQFQWTDRQIDLVRSLLALLPQQLRMYRWNTLKEFEGRPTPAQVVAVSPFESIRSNEIVPLFHRYFDIFAIRSLGGTLQHLLYNGIAHNFRPEDPMASEAIRAIYLAEDALIDGGLLPSDFMLLVGQRRD